jgi:hypothetical protein
VKRTVQLLLLVAACLLAVFPYRSRAVEGPAREGEEVAPAVLCPAVDPGPKGLNVHPNELPHQVPTIAQADTGWVRLEFRRQADGTIDLARYDSVVDGLCGAGIGVVGLVDYMTIPEDLDGNGKKDYDDPDAYEAYQTRFVDTVEGLAVHFQGRIRAWEVWNEENGQQWHVPAEYYARLLVKVSEAVKGADAENKIVFGGLDHVWVTSQYLEPVYDVLDLDWGGARPFDILAVHPYFIKRSGLPILDPNVYLWEESSPSQTVLDVYLDYMASRGDGDRDIWITEIGWNSALDNPAIANCQELVPWCVGRMLQARYLGDSFDILFNEVEDPQGNHDRVKKIFWYQYQDTAVSLAKLAEKLPVRVDDLGGEPSTICPADWGLVDGNRAPKSSYRAYQVYPRRLDMVYLPVILR